MKRKALIVLTTLSLLGVESLPALESNPMLATVNQAAVNLPPVSSGIDDLLPNHGRVGAAALELLTLPAGERFHSTTLQESSPVQTTGGALPEGVSTPKLVSPGAWTRWVAFAGKPGQSASHEGLDLVHHDPKIPHVLIVAAAPGVVAYVRTGCPQSAVFTRNTRLREGGAGWGNHVVLAHGNGLYTRYAHLAPDSIRLKPGDKVPVGTVVGEMGNSGRSEVRHLHFEVGFKKAPFLTEKPAQSFDLVFDPRRFLSEL